VLSFKHIKLTQIYRTPVVWGGYFWNRRHLAAVF